MRKHGSIRARPDRWIGAAALIAAAAAGCAAEDAGGTEAAETCCAPTDFQVGGAVAAGGEASAQVTMQAIADVANAAAATLTDATTGCRALAAELGAPIAELARAEALLDRAERLLALCELAAGAVEQVRGGAGGELRTDLALGARRTSVLAMAACQARCAGATECDLTLHPPTCEGGTLVVTCDGTCLAGDDPAILCAGACDGAAEPVACEDGVLAGGCRAGAVCEAGCDAAVLVQASFDPARVEVEIAEPTDAGAAAIVEATLEARLPALLGAEARLDAVVEALGVLGQSPESDLLEGAEDACVAPAGEALDGAIRDVEAAAVATRRVMDVVRGPT